MKINWKVRFQHKQFLIAFFALLFLLGQQVAALFGYELSEQLSGQLTTIFNTVLSLLVLLGVVVDPTTQGTSDSSRALSYKEPK
ncbi:MAG: phage holin [Lysinibacillus sp.]